jgi:RimJ/RimL family protein N-acetyltransferase
MQKSKQNIIDIKIDYLRNYPDYVQTCALWSFNTWGHRTPDRSLDDFIASRQEYLNNTQLPLTLIALVDNKPVGMCSLSKIQKIRSDLKPWLGTLFVQENYRNRGIGGLLESSICQLAINMKYTDIYCYTSDKSVISWYENHNWKQFATDYVHDNVEVTILKKKLTT